MPEFQPVTADERVRVLESRYSLMRDRLFLINQNMLTEYKRLNKEIRFIDDELKGLKQEVNEVKNLLRKLISEIDGFARKEDLKVVQKYLDIINPINFMTEDDVKKIIRGEHHSKGTSRRES